MALRAIQRLNFLSAATVAATNPCLFYGAAIYKTGNCSLTVMDWGAMTGFTRNTHRVLTLSKNVSGVGECSRMLPFPVLMANGIFATQSAGGAVATIFYSNRT